jgi:ATP-dependent DNA helicase Rep
LVTFGAFINRVQARAQKEGPEASAEILDELISAIGYERHLYDTLEERQAQARWQNVLDLMAWLKRKAQEDSLTVIDLVQHIALVSMLERHDEADPDAVKLSTLHASKGLEYPHVFLVGVEEGLLPHMGREDDEHVLAADAQMLAARVQEERRLMYVGITRAQRTLTLSWCKRRRRAREDVVREPSRFIGEMGLGSPSDAAPDPQANYSPKERLNALKSLLQKT